MLQTPETNQSVPQSRGHQPGEERFRVIHSDTIRVKLPVGTKMSPHKHPEDRIYTVISGVFYIGLGEEFDETKLTAHGGPLGLAYIDPADDPRSQGPGKTDNRS
jgi:quercetin dioxygenase-like cupin family protein